jgi:hypothetical protein
MDPVTLATAAVTLLVPFFKRLGEKALDRAGGDLADAAEAKVEALYERIKAKLVGDDYNGALLQGVEADPDSPNRRANLQGALVEQLQQDEGFKAALERLVTEAQAAGAMVSIQASNTGAVAGRDFRQEVHGKGANIGRDQINYGRSSASPPSDWTAP